MEQPQYNNYSLIKPGQLTIAETYILWPTAQHDEEYGRKTAEISEQRQANSPTW